MSLYQILRWWENMTSNKSFLKKYESEIFKKTLKKIQKQKFWIPNEIFEIIHSTFSMWTIEIIILQDNKVFLIKTPKHFKKGLWCLPGGYNRWDEEIFTSCERIANREIGISVKPLKSLGIYKWKEGEHPYGRPLSVFILCKPLRNIKDSFFGKLFDFRKLPKMIPCQEKFLKSLHDKKITTQ